MLAQAIRYVLGAILGLAMGVSSALYFAGLWPGMKPLDFGNVEVAGWHSDFAIGSKAADPYTRARLARHGLLALAKSEAVYFTRTKDDTGAPLQEEYTYRIKGGSLPAQWWSIMLCASDGMLPLNSDGAFSVDATSVTYSDGGSWSALVSSRPPVSAPDWISSRNAGTFDLVLRLYIPNKALLVRPQETLHAPVIERQTCKGDTP